MPILEGCRKYDALSEGSVEVGGGWGHFGEVGDSGLGRRLKPCGELQVIIWSYEVVSIPYIDIWLDNGIGVRYSWRGWQQWWWRLVLRGLGKGCDEMLLAD